MKAPNNRINSLAGSLGQKHVGSLRFARYYSLRTFARYAGRYTLMRLFASVFLLASPALAGEQNLNEIFGNDRFLNSELVLTGYLSAVEDEKMSQTASNHYPIMYFYGSKQDYLKSSKRFIFFDTQSEYCQQTDCTEFVGHTIKITGSIRYIGEPVNFHSITDIKSIIVVR